MPMDTPEKVNIFNSVLSDTVLLAFLSHHKKMPLILKVELKMLIVSGEFI